MKRLRLRFVLVAILLAAGVVVCGWVLYDSSGDWQIAARIQEFRTEKAYSAAQALVRAGPRAVPQLARALGDPDWEIRSGSAYVLGQLGEAALPAVPALRDLLADPAARVRGSAAEALGRLGASDPETLQVLRQTLIDENHEVRTIAGMALGWIGPEGVPHLRAGLNQDDANVRAVAAHGLGFVRVNAEAVVPDLMALLADPEDMPRLRAAQALGRIGPASAPAVASLRRLLAKTRQWDDVGYVIDAFGGLGPSAHEAIPDLIELLTDRRESTRMAAATSLGQIADGSSAAVPVLEKMAEGDESPNVRLACTTALELIRGR